MPFEVNLDSDEHVIFEETYQPSKKTEPFAFVVTNRSVFLPAKKRFAVRDPWYFKRVALSNIREVSLERVRPYALWVLSILMIGAGFVTSLWMLRPIFSGQGGRVSGYPIAVFVVGLVLPFLASRRTCLLVSMTNGSFRWKSPLAVDRTARESAKAVQERILDACRRAGIVSVDRRLA